MLTMPACGGIPYDDADMVFLVNRNQVVAYLVNDHALHLYDVFLGYDNKLIYVFRKADTKELFRKWKNHELSVPHIAGGASCD